MPHPSSALSPLGSCQLVVSGTQLHLLWTLWTTPQSIYQASTATIYHQSSKVRCSEPVPRLGPNQVPSSDSFVFPTPNRLIRVGRIGSFTPSRHPPILLHPPRENTIPTPALPGPITTDQCLSCDRRPHPIDHIEGSTSLRLATSDGPISHSTPYAPRSAPAALGPSLHRPCPSQEPRLSSSITTRTQSLVLPGDSHPKDSTSPGATGHRRRQPPGNLTRTDREDRPPGRFTIGFAQRRSATRPVTNPRYTSALTLLSRRCRGLGAPRLHRCRPCLYLTRHESPSPVYLRFPLSRVNLCTRTLGIGQKPDPRHLLLADLGPVASFPSLTNLLDRCSLSGADHPALDRA